MIRYRSIIKQAWQTTINNRWLWIIGLFAAALTNIGQYNRLLSAFDGGGWTRILNSLFNYWRDALLLFNFSTENPILLLGGLLILILGLALIFLAVNSQILLVKKVQASLKAKDKKAIEPPSLSFWKQIKTSWPIFWPTVGVIVAIKFVLLACLIVVSLTMAGVYLISQPIIATFLYVLLVLFFLATIWLIGVWGRYWLLLFLSDKNNNWLVSAKQAWRMLCQNLLTSLEMFVIIALINFLAYLLWIFAIYLLAIPFSLLTILLIKYLAVSEILMIMLAKILLIASLIFLVGAMTVFENSLWLNFIDKLASQSIISKVSRVFRRR